MLSQGYDLMQDVYSPKTFASNFVFTVCDTKRKTQLPKFMAHVVAILNEYLAAATAGNVPVHVARQMDGALLAIGTLCPVIKSKTNYRVRCPAALLQNLIVNIIIATEMRMIMSCCRQFHFGEDAVPAPSMAAATVCDFTYGTSTACLTSTSVAGSAARACKNGMLTLTSTSIPCFLSI